MERWDSKVEVQGAAGVPRCWVVVDMVRRRERRRRTGREAMMVVLSVQWGGWGKVCASTVVSVATRRLKIRNKKR